MDFLTDITQFTGQHQFYLGMYILHIVLNHKLSQLCFLINSLQFLKQDIQFLRCQQPYGLKHRDMSHRPQYVMLGQIQIQFTILADRELFYLFIYFRTFFPKFTCHFLFLSYYAP